MLHWTLADPDFMPFKGYPSMFLRVPPPYAGHTHTHMMQTGTSSPNDFVFGSYDPRTEKFGNVSEVFSLGVGSHWGILGNDMASGQGRYLFAAWVDGGYGVKHGPATPGMLTLLRAVTYAQDPDGGDRLVAMPVSELALLRRQPPLLREAALTPLASLAANFSLAGGGAASIDLVAVFEVCVLLSCCPCLCSSKHHATCTRMRCRALMHPCCASIHGADGVDPQGATLTVTLATGVQGADTVDPQGATLTVTLATGVLI